MLKLVKSSSKRRLGGAALGDEGELQVTVLGRLLWFVDVEEAGEAGYEDKGKIQMKEKQGTRQGQIQKSSSSWGGWGRTASGRRRPWR